MMGNFATVRRFGRRLAGVGFVTLGAAGSAQAAIDTAALDTALQGVEAEAESVAGSIVPIVVAVLAISIGIKLVKRFGNKI